MIVVAIIGILAAVAIPGFMMKALTKEYPATDTNHTLGTAPDSTTIGTKFNPVETTNKTNLKAKAWTDLNFTVSSPFYYYNYAEATNDGLSRFQAKALRQKKD